MRSNIYILSKAIKTGKTTELLEWVKTKNNIGGILTPDVNGLRKLYDIATEKLYDFQVENATFNDEITEIGKYKFLSQVFQKAQHLISTESNFNYLIIDEIGRLELKQNKGLEPVLSDVIHKYVNGSKKNNLLLVIRDYLLNDCIKKYHLQQAKIIQSVSEIETDCAITGLVLGGGKSSRMNSDKALINYYNKPQVYHVSDQLNQICSQVFISINQFQNAFNKQAYQYIYDNATYKNNGPISGILSAFELFPNEALFVVGCDYPLLQLIDLINLKYTFWENKKTVTFYNSETNFREPLLGIYHANDLINLKKYFDKGKNSLQLFLNEINAIKLIPSNQNSIKSIDTPLEFDTINKQFFTNL